MLTRFLRVGVLLAVGCAAAPLAPSPPPSPLAEAPVAAAPPPASAMAPAPAAIPAPVPEPAPEPARPRENPGFPPARYPAPFAKSALPGDGTWTAFTGIAGGRKPILVESHVHPHPTKRAVHVVVVAADLAHLALRLVAGTLEPASFSVPQDHRVGLVPPGDQADLVAVFNGGFMARHGGFGMRVGADVFLPPLDDACTVGLRPDGTVSIAPYAALKVAEPTFEAYRQTPPCLVRQGELAPDLDSKELARKWGGAVGGARDIRRSSLGLDAEGKILFYGLGEGVTAKDLATAMKAAGAADAAELDINWSYTRFLFFGRAAPGQPLQVTGTLIPKLKHTLRGYVGTPSERDFFYLLRRDTAAAAPGTVSAVPPPAK